MTFREALVLAYREEPCRVLPNAAWKTLREVDRFETSFEIENGVVVRFEMGDEEGLHVYWHRDRHPPNIPENRVGHLSFVLIHQEYLQAFPVERFEAQKPYFRLIHRNGPSNVKELPSGFRMVNVNTITEADAVAQMIRDCYDDLNLSGESVQKWATYPVFDRDSWI